MKLGGFPERIWASRLERIGFVLAAGLLLATNIGPGPPPPLPMPAEASLSFEPVALDPDDRRRRRIGRLLFLGGWVLRSDNHRFGAISAIHVEGGRVTALSDAGILLRFPLPEGGNRVRLDPLPSGPGPATRKSNRDTEAMLIGGDSLWAAFEKHNMVWRYRRGDLRATAAARPAAIRRWPSNAGAEAMVRLADGRFLILSEGRNDGREHSEAVLFDGDPAEPGTGGFPLRYRRPPGFRVTDAALLPDGRLLLLNRRFAVLEGMSAVLTVAETRGLRAGATIEGREVAALRAPLTVDNMEALSVTVENGRTIVWIASDDNFFPLQRTLLLKFELIE